MLRIWADWRADPQRPAQLHLVWMGLESAQTLRALRPPPQALPMGDLLGQAQGLLPGLHRLMLEDGALLLTLGIGQALPLLRAQDLEVDEIQAGLADLTAQEAPLWGRTLARCSRRGTHLQVATADDALAKALVQEGFRVEAEAGPAAGLRAAFDPAWQPRRRRDPNRAASSAEPGRCLVIGAGLAGAACAASLARRGWQVAVLDRLGPASGASGLPAGLMAPHVSPDDSPLSRISRAGVRATLAQARRLLREGEDWAASGVLQRRLDGGPALPIPWPQAGHDWTCEAGAQTALPADLRQDALWHPCGAWIRPARLVRAWLAQPGITLHTGGHVHCLRRASDGLWQAVDAGGQRLGEAELVVLAAAHDSQALLQRLMPGAFATGLQAIRGQVSWGLQAPGELLPPVPVNGHGSLLPGLPTEGGSAWVLGATFGRDEQDTSVRPTDHAAVLEKLERLLPHTAQSLRQRLQAGQVQAWAGVRCAWRDHLPLVGPISPRHPGLWLCTAFGSRGLSCAALCAELLAAWLHDEPLPLEPRLAQLLQASRLLGP